MAGSTSEQILKELEKLNRNMSNQNKYYSGRQVAARSILTGVFTAFGATIGFGMILFVGARLLSQVSTIPIIDVILKETNLDKIIEYQLNQINRESSSPTPTQPALSPTPSSSPSPTVNPTNSITPEATTSN